MNKNDRAHPSLSVYENLPADVKAKYTYRKRKRRAPRAPTTKAFKKNTSRLRQAIARFSRWLNRGAR